MSSTKIIKWLKKILCEIKRMYVRKKLVNLKYILILINILCAFQLAMVIKSFTNTENFISIINNRWRTQKCTKAMLTDGVSRSNVSRFLIVVFDMM